MTDLKPLYRQAVVVRIAEIHAALDAGEPVSAAREQALRSIAHSLRGSGGTYGFPEVSTAAGAVEDAPSHDVAANARELLLVLDRIVSGGPKPVNVLIVDDDPEILLLLTTVLSGDGRQLHTANSGASAMLQFDRGGFALVVLDLMLPDADGFDLLERIRHDSRYDNTPVLVLSAKTTAATKEKCEKLGATAFFEKPFDPDAVAAAVVAQLVRAADIGDGIGDDIDA